MRAKLEEQPKQKNAYENDENLYVEDNLEFDDGELNICYDDNEAVDDSMVIFYPLGIDPNELYNGDDEIAEVINYPNAIHDGPNLLNSEKKFETMDGFNTWNRVKQDRIPIGVLNAVRDPENPTVLTTDKINHLDSDIKLKVNTCDQQVNNTAMATRQSE